MRRNGTSNLGSCQVWDVAEVAKTLHRNTVFYGFQMGPHLDHYFFDGLIGFMVEPRLIELLRCPITLRPLRAADEELLSQLNAAIETGDLTNRLGETVTHTMDEALVDETDEYAVPVYQGIPNLVLDELIPLAQLQQRR